MSDYLNMGGYAAFVWPAFALSAIVLVTLLATSLKTLRNSERALDEAAPAKSHDEA